MNSKAAQNGGTHGTPFLILYMVL